ncbi:MAG: glycosyltransferase family 2 protein [Hyphomicrobiaceae bacterium]
MATVKPPTLSILIVSYNTRAMTVACLDSIASEAQHVSYELIVIDNASTDGSPQAVAAHASKPTLIPLTQNIGFARANNVAARAARGEYILLLNPDTEIRHGAIDKLVGFARRRRQSRIWGGRTIFADGRLNPASAWARQTPWRLFCRAAGLTGLAPKTSVFNGEAYGGWQRDGERNVDIVSGCFLLIEHELWRELGGFDPLYFMYGEDADLCLRAKTRGAKPRTTDLATIVHHGGASEPARADKMVRLLTAKATLIQRHFQAPLVPLGLALQAAWPLSRAIAYGLAAIVLPTSQQAATAREWAEIWRRRDEWYAGYEASPHANVPSATKRATAT